MGCSCLHYIINILLTQLIQSVWKNLDLGRVHKAYCVWSVLKYSVKILPYRPPARLIRAKYIRNTVKFCINFHFLQLHVSTLQQ